MTFELNREQAGDWDRFQVRKIGFKAQRHKATHFTELLDLKDWDADDRKLLSRIMRAKSGPEETMYLELMRKNRRLREAIIKLGS